jgi:hypothetical protein
LELDNIRLLIAVKTVTMPTLIFAQLFQKMIGTLTVLASDATFGNLVGVDND